MKTIGLIGGMSWLSTIEYYRILNEVTSHWLGKSAKIIVYSVDFQYVIKLQQQGEWDEAGRYLGTVAQSLESAGAELLLIGAVTMHKVAHLVQQAIQIPILHIVDVTADKIKSIHIKKIGLIGTCYTMEDTFFIERLSDLGIEVVVPIQQERNHIHRIIFKELTRGKKTLESKAMMLEIMENLRNMGAEGVILGCTELSTLIKQEDIKLPIFDTTYLHASSAVNTAFIVG